MKILILVNSIESVLLFRFQLLLDLKKRSHDVVVYAPDAKKDIVDRLERSDIKFKKFYMSRTGVNPILESAALFNLYLCIKKEKPDMVLSYTLKPVIYGSFASGLAKVPAIFSVITGIGSIFLGTNNKTKVLLFLIKPLYRLALRCNRKVFVLNPDISKIFAQHGILDSNKTVILNGEGVDIKKYDTRALPACKFPVYLIITRLIIDKGICEYIKAAKQIKKKYPSAKFLIVGQLDSNPTALTKKEFESMIADGSIEFLGQLNDVRDAIVKSSIYVLPSYAEGIPRSTLEAMSMGCPVITTDAPGCRETVIEGVNGYLVPIKNVKKLAEAMEKFILHPELISEMGKESRKIVEKKYDVRKVNKTILNTIGA